MMALNWDGMGQVGSNMRPEFWGSHALIGVAGAEPGTAAETVAQQNYIALAGVLAAQVPVLPGGAAELGRLLGERALEADGKIAVYLSGLEAGDTVAVARAH